MYRGADKSLTSPGRKKHGSISGGQFMWHLLTVAQISDLYASPNIVRMIKSRRMRWAGHVARMGEERGVYRV